MFLVHALKRAILPVLWRTPVHGAGLDAGAETAPSSASKAGSTDTKAHAGLRSRNGAIGAKLRRPRASRRDAGKTSVDGVLIESCEKIRRLHHAYEDGLAQLAATEARNPASRESEALVDLQWPVYLEYEARVFGLKEKPARGAAGLLAKGDRLEAFLEFRAESLEDGLLQVLKAYFDNVRRVVSASEMALDRRPRRRSSQPGNGGD